MATQNSGLPFDYSGASGVTRSGAEKFPNPFFDIASEYVPSDINQIFELTEFLMMTMAPFRAVTQRVVRYFLTEIVLEGGEAEDREHYEDLFSKQLKLLDLLGEVGDDFQVYGNVFLSLYLPFDRMLVCPQCKTNYHVETDIKWKFRDGGFVARCPKCGYDGVFGHKDRCSPDVSRVKLIRWNPKFVSLRVHPVSGRTEYYLQLDRELVRKIQEGNPFYLNDTPWSMIECALQKKDNLFRFREGQLFHLKAGSLAGLPIRGWGLPPMLPNFKLAYYIQLLRRYDEAITLDYIVPFRVLFPQAQTADGKDALSMMSMGTFVSQMKNMVDNHRRQLTDIQVAPFPVGYQMLGGEAKALSPKESIQAAFDELFTSMGYPVELYKGSLSLQAAPVALRLFEKEQCHLVHGYNDILKWIVGLVGRYFRWETRKIDVKLRPVTLADDIERKAIMLQSAAGQDISKQTAYRTVGIDYMDEQRRVVEEQKEIMRLQRKAQEEAVQQPLDGSGGENSGSGAVTGATPGDVAGQASDLAAKLISMDPTSRRRVLLDVKKTNPTMHALIIADLEDMRNQAASQGRQMAGQM